MKNHKKGGRMPRTRRIVLPDCPHHILQRGHNKQAVFKGEEDFLKYLGDLRELKELFGVRVYAWCMTSNQVHLLVNPGDNGDAMGAFMKGLSARATRHRNRMELRSGTLWEGRYRSSPVHSDWLLPCMRYIEQVPVDLGLVRRPEDYRWSSYPVHVGEATSTWLNESPAYCALGKTIRERRDQFRSYVQGEPDEDEWRLIHEAVRRNQLTGDANFADHVEAMTGVRVPNRGRGRPKKERHDDDGEAK